MVQLVNTTIYANNSEGGISYSAGIENVGGINSDLTLINTILWNNSPAEINGEATVSYSNIAGGWEGTDNINSDPSFVDPDNSDFHLNVTSPSIDTGNPTTEYNDTDGSRNNMGAYGGPGGNW